MPQINNKHIRLDNVLLLVFILLYVIVNMLSVNLPFFWDTILISRIATFFLDSEFSTLNLPLEMDAGHPPFFALYIAYAWKLFGKTLIASHLAMLPVLIGMAWQLFRFARQFVSPKYMPVAVCFLFFEPTVLAQSTMVSTDIVMVFFYFLALNSLIKRQKILYIIALTALMLINVRGIVLTATLFFTDLILMFSGFNKAEKNPLKILIPYLVSIIPLLIWLFYHYNASGWILFTPSDSWSSQRGLETFGGMLRNSLIFDKNLMDFGRIFMLGWLIVFIINSLLGLLPLTSRLKTLITIALTTGATMELSMIPFSNPIGHRYLMVLYVIVTVIFCAILDLSRQKIEKHHDDLLHKNIIDEKEWFKGHEQYIHDYIRPFTIPNKFVIAVVLVGLITGHLWCYPDKIAQGWDSSLAHIPYFSLRKKMNNYLIKNNYNIDEIGTHFPYYNPKYTDLSDTLDLEFKKYDFDTNRFIIQSNVINEFTDKELDILQLDWNIVKEFECYPVSIKLFERKPDY